MFKINLNHDVWCFFLFILILFFLTINGVATSLFFACMYLDMQTAIVYISNCVTSCW